MIRNLSLRQQPRQPRKPRGMLAPTDPGEPDKTSAPRASAADEAFCAAMRKAIKRGKERGASDKVARQ